ncbi:CDP-diacylglycerol--glycerol-3-phosphate 3-phosphatidyltransferase [Clostridiaceae bacterium JG1575]|nr:CDP-diacylglycerol--glycerol-3-phosphate 3-phosphatidyltransferase [Clostridiaceae bacterium JG1575]
MNIPNLISLFRILLIPVFIYTFVTGSGSTRIVGPIIIFVISGASDVLDGYIARKYHLQTPLGAVLDPLADKLMLLTALICFAVYEYIPLWIVALVAAKELLMITGGILAWRRGIVTRANLWGKLATTLFHLAIVGFLFSRTFAFVLLIFSLGVSFYALFNYAKITLEKRRAQQNAQKKAGTPAS